VETIQVEEATKLVLNDENRKTKNINAVLSDKIS